MAIGRIFALALRIVRQFLRDRRTMALLFLAPLLVMTLLNFILNASSAGAAIDVVASGDNVATLVANQIHQRLNGQNGFSVRLVASDAVAESDLKAGDADAALLFPDGFAQQVQSGTATLTLRLEGSSPATAKQTQGIVALLVGGLAGGSTVGAAPKIAVTTQYLYGGPEYTQTDALAPLFIGLFSFFFVFLLTSVSFLRERSGGTIERLLVSPLNRTELVLGYVVGFTLFALAQSLVILLYVINVLRVHYAGNLGLLFLITSLLTIGGVNMGIFVSAFARNELQVIQFIPLLLVPQILLGGLFFPVKTLPVVLHQLAYALPLTYANFALKDVMLRGFGLDAIWPDLLFLVGFATVMIIGAAFSLRQDRV
jgi:ABC-2 type transport system permease protein